MTTDAKDEIPVNPEILIWARQTLGLSPAEVVADGQLTPAISVPTLQAWESSADSWPTHEQLEQLAIFYSRPLALFFFPEPPPEETITAKLSSLPAAVATALPAAVYRSIRQGTIDYLGLKELFPEQRLADRRLWRDIVITDSSGTQAHVQQARDALHDTGAARTYPQWRDEVESAGIAVFEAEFGGSALQSFSLFHDDFPLITLKNSLSPAERVYYLRYELYHLLRRQGGLAIRGAKFSDPTAGPGQAFAQAFPGATLPDPPERLAAPRTLSDLSPRYLARVVHLYYANKIDQAECADYLRIEYNKVDDLLDQYETLVRPTLSAA